MNEKNINGNGVQVGIDFLYLDLDTCGRCMETESNLDDAVSELTLPLMSMGYGLTVNKVNIASEDLAEKYRFESSPTIRVNGMDILGEVKENICGDCSQISNNATKCRVFEYKGKDFEQPPKAMIMEGILGCLFSGGGMQAPKEYTVPENIRDFFKKPAKCCGCSCGEADCC
ncbi:MAG: DUF2703 domain-containing protein [Clostridia bacterium]|nr:DUF2703 domain-containing protein [Clostridia bacterium]